MTGSQRAIIIYSVLAATLAAALVALIVVGPRFLGAPPPEEAAAPPPATEVRKIHARLLYVAEDGVRLTAVEREVLFGDGATEQAKRIIEAQVAPVAAPLVSAIPPGTKLKTVFVTEKGEAYIDLSPELRANHPGGTTNELLTAYTLVGALTLNLPKITGVQILVDGKEVDTLAGHLDLRHPLEQDGRWMGE